MIMLSEVTLDCHLTGASFNGKFDRRNENVIRSLSVKGEGEERP